MKKKLCFDQNFTIQCQVPSKVTYFRKTLLKHEKRFPQVLLKSPHLTWPLPESSCSRTDSPTIQRNPIVPNGATAESPLYVGSKNNPAGLILLSSDPPIHENPHKFNIKIELCKWKNLDPLCSTGFGLHQTSPDPPTLLTNLGATHCLTQMAPILLDILWWIFVELLSTWKFAPAL